MNKRKRTKLLNDMVDDNQIELALEGDVPIYVHKKHITVPKEVEEFEEPIYRYVFFSLMNSFQMLFQLDCGNK